MWRMEGTALPLSGLNASEVAFWTGAGISADAPTSCPLGRTLTDRALDTYFEPGLAERLNDLYEKLRAPNAGYRPRLETVLDVVTEVSGLGALDDILSDLRAAPPNDVHRFFARHLALGGNHITANFDTCIERAGIGAGQVLHIHGSLEDELSALGARLCVIQNGLPEHISKALDNILEYSGVRALVFAGYSGSDFFDVTPYLSRRWRCMAGKTIVWHAHTEPEQPTLFGQDCDSHPYLKAARAAGARVCLVRAPLRKMLNALADMWELPELPPPPSGVQAWSPGVGGGRRRTERCTDLLLSKMGARGEVLARMASRRVKSPQDWMAYADALWGAGRYREALRAWQLALGDGSLEGDVRLAERRAAVAWVRGQYLRAERILRRALDAHVYAGSPVLPSDQVLLVETYGRVLTHMGRCPDVRMFATRSKRSRCTADVRRLASSMDDGGVHLRARMQSLLSNLEGAPDAQAEEHPRVLGESESLQAWLNYRHHLLRTRSNAGTPPSKSELDDLRDAHAVLGSFGDGARVVLLPGAAHCYRASEAWVAFGAVDVTAWHRLRLGGGHALKRFHWLSRRSVSRALSRTRGH